MTIGTGTVLDGRYELGAILGRGGMGRVFRAHDARLGRDVAVKVLDGAMAGDGEFLARFQREARAAASLNHPGIVGVYDRGEQDGDHYIVMEVVDGPTLGDVLRSEGPLEPERVLALGAAVADALGAAHRVGLVHRDVKPSNVLVTPDGHVKVTDFGIARGAADATLTTTDSVLGSIPFVAPEQVRGQPATPASDVYALGCLLYALLTGDPPFRGEAAVSVLHQHIAEEPEPPSERRAELAPEVDDVLLALLAKQPEDRPADGAAAAALLRSVYGSDTGAMAAVLPAEVLERTRVMGTIGTGSATQLLAGDASATRVLGEDEADEPIDWGRRLLAVALLAVALLAVALFGNRLAGDTTTTAPDDPTQAPSEADVSPSPTAAASPEPETVAGVIDRISQMLSASRGGSMSTDAADKLAEKLFKVGRKFEEGDLKDAASELDGLRRELDKRTRDDQVTAERAAELDAELDQLEQLVDGAAGRGGDGQGDEGDEGDDD